MELRHFSPPSESHSQVTEFALAEIRSIDRLQGAGPWKQAVLYRRVDLAEFVFAHFLASGEETLSPSVSENYLWRRSGEVIL